jgi:two-component sensor histidine kinase
MTTPTAEQLARVRAQAHADRELYAEGTSQWWNADAMLALLDSHAALVAREAKLREVVERLLEQRRCLIGDEQTTAVGSGIGLAVDAIQEATKP